MAVKTLFEGHDVTFNFYPMVYIQKLGKLDIDKLVETAFSLMDGFQEKSKILFGNGLEENPQYPGLAFVLPLLSASDFFQEPPEERAKWFQLFSVYLTESPVDNGILLASALDLREVLNKVVAELKNENLHYRIGA